MSLSPDTNSGFKQRKLRARSETLSLPRAKSPARKSQDVPESLADI